MLRWLSGLPAALILICAAGGTFIHVYGLGGYYNSDWLFLEALYRDIFLEQGSLANWSLPPAPYYVEMPLYFALRCISGDVHGALAAFSASQIVLLIVAVWCVFSALVPVRKKAMWEISHLVASLTAAVLILFLATRGSGVFLYLNTNNAHMLTVVCSIFGLSLVLALSHPTTRSARRWRLIALVLLSCATTASDLFYLVWFVLPMLLCLGILHLGMASRTRRRCGTRIALALCLGVLAGLVLEWAVRFQPRYGIEPARPSLDFLLNGWQAMVAPALWHFASVCNIALLLGGFAGAVLCLSRPVHRAHPTQPANVLGLFMLLSLPVTLLIIHVNGYAGISRYYLGCVLYPALLGLPWLVERLRLKTLHGLIAVAALPLCAYLAFFNHTLRPPYTPPLVACVDQLAERWNARTGMAGYWGARYITLLTHSGLFVESTVAHGRYRNPYLNPARPRVDTYELVIADPYTPTRIPGQELDVAVSLSLYGRPDALAFCPGLDGTPAGAKVLLYKKGVPLLDVPSASQ